jgi:putative sterol carrier protein
VIHCRFTDAAEGERRWWLVVDQGSADLCRDNPGEEPTLIVESTVRTLTEIWTGDLDAESALRERRLRVIGTESDTRSLWRWLGRSAFADTRTAARL